MRFIAPIFTMLMVLFTPVLAFAQEVTEPVAGAPSNFDPSQLSGWQYIVYTVIILAVGYAMKLWRSRIKSENDAKNVIIDKRLLENRELLLDRIEATAYRCADTWVEDDLPSVLVDALNGDGEFNWKLHATQGFRTVRAQVIQCFKDEGIDLVARVGSERLNGIIKSAIMGAIKRLPDKLKAFLPEAMVEPLVGMVSKFVTAKTADWISSLGD